MRSPETLDAGCRIAQVRLCVMRSLMLNKVEKVLNEFKSLDGYKKLKSKSFYKKLIIKDKNFFLFF